MRMNGRWRLAGAAAGALLLVGAPLAAQEGAAGERECRCAVRELTDAPRLRALFGGGARLGIEIESREADRSRGAIVRRVLPGTPAEEAGLGAGDEIVAVNGASLLRPLAEDEPEEDPEESLAGRRLIAVVRRSEPGDTMSLEVLRDGQRQEIRVVTREGLALGGSAAWRMLEGSLPRTFRFEGEPGALRISPSGGRARLFFERRGALGARLQEMSLALGEYFGVERGVLVLEVDDDAPLPLRAGDVILSLGGREVRDLGHLRAMLASYREGETLRLEIVRKGERTTVEGRLP